MSFDIMGFFKIVARLANIDRSVTTYYNNTLLPEYNALIQDINAEEALNTEDVANPLVFTGANDLQQKRTKYAQIGSALFTDPSYFKTFFSMPPSAGTYECIGALHQYMLDNNHTIKRNTCPEPTVLDVFSTRPNAGNGVIVPVTMLSGTDSPGTGQSGSFRSYHLYAGIQSELMDNASFYFECIDDSVLGNVELGKEVWQFNTPPSYAKLFPRHLHAGSPFGDIGSIVDYSRIQNPLFEIAPGPSLQGWFASTSDIDIYTTGGHVTPSRIVFKSMGSVLKQFNIPLTAHQAIIVGFWARRLIILDPLCEIRVKLESNNQEHTILTKSIMSINNTDYELVTQPVIVPPIGKIFTLKIDFDGPNYNNFLAMDSFYLSTIPYISGFGVAVFPGNQRWRIKDRFFINTSNQRNGIIQTWLLDAYGVQLPSSTTPNIPDTP